MILEFEFGGKRLFWREKCVLCTAFFHVYRVLLNSKSIIDADPPMCSLFFVFCKVLHPAADKTISHFLFCIAFVAVFITQTIHLSIHHVSAQR